MRCAVTLLATGALALLVAGCGQIRAGDEPEPTTNEWVRAPDAPLSSREGALGIWTGAEALIIGGSDARPCPPNADCVAPDEPPLRDGAALDPGTHEWRSIADAPHGFANADGLVLDGIAYVWASGYSGRPGSDFVFMAYDIAADRWRELPRPANRWASITATEDKLVAFATSDEGDAPPDFLFDPATEAWTTLPDDPLPPSFDRTMSWDGEQLVLFGKKDVFSPGSKEPAVALAAALDLESGEWRRFPDSASLDQFIADVRWFESDGLLINPAPGHSPSWGPRYGYGGVLDPVSGQWSELPEPPPGSAQSGGTFGAGMIGSDDEAHYFGIEGWILDVGSDRWIEIPQLDDAASIGSSTVTRAGWAMLVFGGAHFNSAGEGTLTNEAWTWSPGRLTDRAPDG